MGRGSGALKGLRSPVTREKKGEKKVYQPMSTTTITTLVVVVVVVSGQL